MEHLSKAFTLHQQNRRIQSIYDVSLSVGMGQFVGITGLSGAGKSTILKCINRTYTTTSGCIYFESPTFGRVDLARCQWDEK